MASNPKNQDDTPVTGEVVKPVFRTDVELPGELRDIISFSGWAESLVNRAKYTEPDPDYLSRMLLMQTLTADTVDDVFTQAGIRKLQEAVPNVPGGSTGPVQITGLYVTDSDFGEGAPCYMILTTTDLETGVVVKYSTGATQLQAQILKLITLGTWPIPCKITRTERKDRGGRFLFWLFPPD